MQMHDRASWIVPAVSLALTTKSECVRCFAIVPCESFVKKMHESHPGRFQGGRGRFWLPECYNAAFLLTRNGKLITVQFLEIIGWNFDPELQKETMGLFARRVGVVVAQFASFCSMTERASRGPPDGRDA
jgi:hypothetical protein